MMSHTTHLTYSQLVTSRAFHNWTHRSFPEVHPRPLPPWGRKHGMCITCSIRKPVEVKWIKGCYFPGYPWQGILWRSWGIEVKWNIPENGGWLDGAVHLLDCFWWDFCCCVYFLVASSSYPKIVVITMPVYDPAVFICVWLWTGDCTQVDRHGPLHNSWCETSLSWQHEAHRTTETRYVRPCKEFKHSEICPKVFICAPLRQALLICWHARVHSMGLTDGLWDNVSSTPNQWLTEYRTSSKDGYRTAK